MGIVKRSDKKSFYGVPSDGGAAYHRMVGFTAIDTSKNPKEYTRQYVDMDSEITDVTGYSPSISVTFDEHTDNAAHKDIIEIFNKEKTGDAAVREIVVVDFTQPVGGKEGSYKAIKRSYAVVPDSEGSGTENYSYVANLKCKGESIEGTATTVDAWETATFTENE